MKEKGFTLIELLAVIVILAIIALIAVPIIINIVNDARENSYKRSVELYGTAVQNAIAKAQLNGQTVPAGELDIDSLNVQYDGAEVTCETNMLYEDGKIYLAGCSVGTHEVDYTYGKAQYAYMWYDGETVYSPSIGDDASSLSTNVPADENYYLKYKLDENNEITNYFACAIFGGQEYCLEGGSINYYGWDTDAVHSTGNVKVLYDIQSANISGVTCSFSSDYSGCIVDGLLYLEASDDVLVYSTADGGGCGFIESRGLHCGGGF